MKRACDAADECVRMLLQKGLFLPPLPGAPSEGHPAAENEEDSGARRRAMKI